MCGMHLDPRHRFLCDQNLGKLAKWLRILGFDADYMSRWDDNMMHQALEEGKIVLTRKSDISPQKGVLFISHDHVREQIQEIFENIDLATDVAPFTRCSLCNAVLVNTSREEVKGDIPEYVYAMQENFAGCPSCGRVYWKGTHLLRIYAMMDSLLKDVKT